MPVPPYDEDYVETRLGQEGRSALLLTALGPDVLNVVRFEGTEGLSELFEYTIEAVAEKVPLDFDAIIGLDCTLVVAGKLAFGSTDRDRDWRDQAPPEPDRNRDRDDAAVGVSASARRFSGILTNVVWLGVDNDYYLYRLTLRPWLHLLSFTTDCRIFHDQPADAIIRQVFSDRGFTNFELRISETCAEREYCVQYRETDLDFVLRLMEEEGIFYFHEHADLKHTLICADSKSAFSPLPAAPTVFYQDRLVSGRSDIGSIREITSVRRFQPGKVALNDYDYAKPTAQMLKDYAHKAPHQRGEMEIYDYPGRYTDPSAGEKLARVILESEQASDKRRQAAGDVVQMTPGGLTTLVNHPLPTENIEYLVVRCTHRFANQAYRTVASVDQGEAYSGIFELQPADIPFRAPRGARKPRVFGPQTAVVVGASGEEVDVDDQGRILVHFFWDRKDDSSRRVRVAQTWAGKNWGSMVIPRIGHEVVVEFLEGDPDQPLVTGCVYNADMPVPYTLAENKTKSGFKSNSSRGGGGFNEFSMDDKKGEEKVEFQAQKDYQKKVLDSEVIEVGEHFTGSGPSSKETIHLGDQDLEIKTGAQNVKLDQGDQNVTLSMGTQSTKIDLGDQNVKLGAGNQSTDAAMNIKTKAGLSISLEANMSIELKCGGSKITMNPAGITIEAVMLTMKGSAMAELQGGAMLTVKGGLVMIN